MNMQEFMKNRALFPAEELAKYAGKYVAWSLDGTHILLSDDDPLRLDAALKEAGYDPAEILVSSVPNPDEIVMGGAGLIE